MTRLCTVFLILGSLLPLLSAGQELEDKAQTFLNSLTPELREEARFAIEDPERVNFHFVPRARKGPTFHDFNPAQKAAALDLLRSSLSEQGYNKAMAIVELEKVLNIMENEPKLQDGMPYRDPLNYHFSIFGEPAPDTPWGWRFEGHHISLNFTASSGKIVASTPSFFGSNPGIVPIAMDRGKQVHKAESTLGLALLNSLTEEQLEQARFSETAPRDILTGNEREVSLLEPRGIPYTDLSVTQQGALMELLEVYIGTYIFDFSEVLRAKIMAAGIENLHFAWAGGSRWGEAHYYRIQGPMLIIEYDNTQNNANHVHTVVRDLTNDFAEDFLKVHYQKDHKN